MSLHGEVALVTGGAVRIGEAIVRVLADAGAAVLVHYRRSRDAAEALVESLGGPPHGTLRADLSSPEESQRLVGRAIEQAGRLDALVNNASGFEPLPIARTTAEDLAATFEANLFAPFHLIRELAAHGKPARVVNLLDRRITSTAPDSAAYSLSKMALAELTRMAAREFAPGLRVNGVAPGMVLPPVGGKLPAEPHARMPLRRRIPPEEVARAVLFLLENPSLTGQILFVDGGEHLLG